MPQSIVRGAEIVDGQAFAPPPQPSYGFMRDVGLIRVTQPNIRRAVCARCAHMYESVGALTRASRHRTGW